jgi:hypothetical protein
MKLTHATAILAALLLAGCSKPEFQLIQLDERDTLAAYTASYVFWAYKTGPKGEYEKITSIRFDRPEPEPDYKQMDRLAARQAHVDVEVYIVAKKDAWLYEHEIWLLKRKGK